MLLLIDNYDSFTYNLYQTARRARRRGRVCRNDSITLAEAESLAPSHIVISPGPCTPDEAGISNALIERLGPRIPTLGVCLGHQCIGSGLRRGGGPGALPRPRQSHAHSPHGAGLFRGLPNPFEATRYHSLIVDRASLPHGAGHHRRDRRWPDHGTAASPRTLSPACSFIPNPS